MRERAEKYALKEHSSIDEITTAIACIDSAVEALRAHRDEVDLPGLVATKAAWLEYGELIRSGASAAALSDWQQRESLRQQNRKHDAITRMTDLVNIPLQKAVWRAGEILDHESINMTVLRHVMVGSFIEGFARLDLFAALQVVRSELDYS